MGREEGGGLRMGNTCIPVVDSFWYLAIIKHKTLILKKKIVNETLVQLSSVTFTLLLRSQSHVRLVVTPWTVACQSLCPWDSPGKNTGEFCHFLLQGIFPTQGSNSHLLHWQVDSSPLSHQGSYIHINHSNLI